MGCRASPAKSRGPANLTVFYAFRLESPCGVRPYAMCELLVGLPEVNVLTSTTWPVIRSGSTSRHGRRDRDVPGAECSPT